MNENKNDLLQEQYVAHGGSTGYVTPISVDNTNVDASESHLNGRERDNIVKASIQANSNISEEQVTTVNNEIRVKKKKPIITVMVFTVLIVVIILIIKLVPPIVNSYTSKNTTTTTTTTTTQNTEMLFLNYLQNNNKLRKFTNDKETFILLPYGYDLHESTYYYAYLSNDNKELGTYKLGSDKLDLFVGDSMKEFNVEKNKIKSTLGLLEMNPDDIKMYSYKDSNISKVVVLNNDNTIVYLDSTNQETSTVIGDYIENDSSIQFDDVIFNKIDNNLEINGIKLTLNE
jgi:hypothetical protein